MKWMSELKFNRWKLELFAYFSSTHDRLNGQVKINKKKEEEEEKEEKLWMLIDYNQLHSLYFEDA